MYESEKGRATPDSAISLQTNRENATSQCASELDFTATNITHGSFRVLARMSGNRGAVGGIRLHHSDAEETNIELLTREDMRQVHFSNEPDAEHHGEQLKDGSFSLPAPDYTSWNVYRIDWLPGETIWFVNGVELTRTNHRVPKQESVFVINRYVSGPEDFISALRRLSQLV